MTDILRLFFIIVLLTASLAAYFLVLGALFANRIAKTQRVINQMSGRSFLVGLVNFLFFSVIAIALFSVAENASGVIRFVLTVPALIITALLMILLSFGLAGMIHALGERILPEYSSLKRTVWGTAILAFACALPFVGWFLLFPYTGLTGFGATILGFFQREK
jgi:sorbitol-specific phosphotransferase system component IIBC